MDAKLIGRITGNVIVGQSGGPTAVINSSVAGVYRGAKDLGVEKVYGMVHGIEGFLEGNIIDLDQYLDSEEKLELLKRTPSAFLGSCRYKLPKEEGNEALYQRIFETLEQYHIEVFFYIGGNDSMDTIKMLSDYAKEHGKNQRFVGIPKTVDNDLPITDHCPGYGSAAKYIATSIKEIIRDIQSTGSETITVVIAEIMGRHAGWLTAAAALAKGPDCAGVDAIYLPEKVFDVEEFVAHVKSVAERKNSVVIAVSEGVKVADGRFVCELGGGPDYVDAFGHKQLSGAAQTLADILGKRTTFKRRAIEFSTLQRAASHLSSATDIDEAFHAGYHGVMIAAEGKTGVMVVLRRLHDSPYLCDVEDFDVHHVANREKKIPLEWITEDGRGLTEDFIQYARPLIMGEIHPLYVNGIPCHLVRQECI